MVGSPSARRAPPRRPVRSGAKHRCDASATRSTTNSLRLRVYSGSFTFSFGVPGGSTPPGFPAASCLPNRQLLVDVSTNAVAGSISFYARTGQAATPQGGEVGQNERAPVAVVAAQVPPATRQAVMHFSGGTTDRATPIADNWVVLASPVPALPAAPAGLAPAVTVTLGTLSIVDHHGHTQSLGSVPAAIGYPIPASCIPRAPGTPGGGLLTPSGPPLPAATGPPPAHAAAAQASIESVFHQFFESPPGTQTGLLEDENTLGEIIHEVQAAPETRQYAGKTKVRIDDFRFLDQTHAALRFDLLVNDQPLSSNVIGRAVLINGHWKVALSTYCQLIADLGIQC